MFSLTSSPFTGKRATALSLLLLLSLGVGTQACSDDKDDKKNEARGCDLRVDTTSYDFDLSLKASKNPPAGFSPKNVPQFVAIGWDDNGFVESFAWALDMLEERELKNSFYLTTTYISDGSTFANPTQMRELWQKAADQGHELGNHTQYHRMGVNFDDDDWSEEISTAFSWLTAPRESDDADADLGVGLQRSEIVGFRSPFLQYNDVLFDVLKDQKLWYDCSIDEGFQLDLDGTDFPWPYTLDEGSQGHDYQQQHGYENRDFSLGKHPGIVELPAYAVVIPPDSVAQQYGFEPGLLERVRENTPAPEEGSDRITGLDYNLWSDAQLNRVEFTAVLKYNLDQRLAGNRAPFLFGAHTDFYRENWPNSAESAEDRRGAIEDFLDYAKSLKDVRVVTYREVFDYMRDPRPLECF